MTTEPLTEAALALRDLGQEIDRVFPPGTAQGQILRSQLARIATTLSAAVEPAGTDADAGADAGAGDAAAPPAKPAPLAVVEALAEIDGLEDTLTALLLAGQAASGGA